jgi:hypothetical protein
MLHAAAAPGARTNASWASGESPSITVRFEVRIASIRSRRDSLRYELCGNHLATARTSFGVRIGWWVGGRAWGGRGRCTASSP